MPVLTRDEQSLDLPRTASTIVYRARGCPQLPPRIPVVRLAQPRDCAVCGARITVGATVRSLCTKGSTDGDLFIEGGTHACAACAYCLQDEAKMRDTQPFGRVFTASSDGGVMVLHDAAEAVKVLTGPLEPPFAIAIGFWSSKSTLWQKHVTPFIRANLRPDIYEVYAMLPLHPETNGRSAEVPSDARHVIVDSSTLHPLLEGLVRLLRSPTRTSRGMLVSPIGYRVWNDLAAIRAGGRLETWRRDTDHRVVHTWIRADNIAAAHAARTGLPAARIMELAENAYHSTTVFAWCLAKSFNLTTRPLPRPRYEKGR